MLRVADKIKRGRLRSGHIDPPAWEANEWELTKDRYESPEELLAAAMAWQAPIKERS